MESWISELGLQKSVAKSRIALQPEYSLAYATANNKPYFGRRLSAFQSPPVRYALQAALAKHVFINKPSVRVLEVGSWAGASAITFGSVIRSMNIPNSEVLCIDQWQPYFIPDDSSIHHKVMDGASETGAIEELFHRNVKACGLDSLIHVMKVSSREALPRLPTASFDLIYIDGSHKKESVLHDLQEAKRLARDGGVICGDDLELVMPEVDLQAHQMALDKDVDFIVDPKSNVGYHPGVTEALSSVFPSVRPCYGFWCIERTGQEWQPPSFQTECLEIPDHLQHAVEIPYGILMGEYEVFQLGGKFTAYPIADPYWLQHRVVETSLEDLVLLLDTIGQIRTQIGPRIVDVKHGFNIIVDKGSVWAVEQSAGEVDLNSAEQRKHLAAEGHLIEAASIGAARDAVDRKVIERELSSIHVQHGDLLRRVGELEQSWWRRVFRSLNDE
jgi:predicted O-methyltransferase YrrM